jgi:hypothetical protein
MVLRRARPVRRETETQGKLGPYCEWKGIPHNVGQGLERFRSARSQIRPDYSAPLVLSSTKRDNNCYYSSIMRKRLVNSRNRRELIALATTEHRRVIRPEQERTCRIQTEIKSDTITGTPS